MNISYNEALKYIRKTATANGLTFKKSSSLLNGAPLWKFEDKKRGENAMNNCQFWTAYEDACSGYIDSFNSGVGVFEGLK